MRAALADPVSGKPLHVLAPDDLLNFPPHATQKQLQFLLDLGLRLFGATTDPRSGGKPAGANKLSHLRTFHFRKLGETALRQLLTDPATLKPKVNRYLKSLSLRDPQKVSEKAEGLNTLSLHKYVIDYMDPRLRSSADREVVTSASTLYAIRHTKNLESSGMEEIEQEWEYSAEDEAEWARMREAARDKGNKSHASKVKNKEVEKDDEDEDLYDDDDEETKAGRRGREFGSPEAAAAAVFWQEYLDSTCEFQTTEQKTLVWFKDGPVASRLDRASSIKPPLRLAFWLTKVRAPSIAPQGSDEDRERFSFYLGLGDIFPQAQHLPSGGADGKKERVDLYITADVVDHEWADLLFRLRGYTQPENKVFVHVLSNNARSKGRVAPSQITYKKTTRKKNSVLNNCKLAVFVSRRWLRVVVHSASLTPSHWKDFRQAVWVRDFEPRAGGHGPQHKSLKDLLKRLFADTTVAQNLQSIDRFEFSAGEGGRFVTSVEWRDNDLLAEVKKEIQENLPSQGGELWVQPTNLSPTNCTQILPVGLAKTPNTPTRLFWPSFRTVALSLGEESCLRAPKKKAQSLFLHKQRQNLTLARLHPWQDGKNSDSIFPLLNHDLLLAVLPAVSVTETTYSSRLPSPSHRPLAFAFLGTRVLLTKKGRSIQNVAEAGILFQGQGLTLTGSAGARALLEDKSDGTPPRVVPQSFHLSSGTFSSPQDFYVSS